MSDNSIAKEIQALQNLQGQDAIDLHTLLQAHAQLRNLRLHYKKQPAEFSSPQLLELKACAEWITAAAAEHCVDLVRQEQLVHAEMARQETRKEALRDLIRQAMQHDHVDQMNVDGILVNLKESAVLALPAAGTKDRTSLESLLRSQGAWDHVSALSVQRLNQYRMSGMNAQLRTQIEAQYGVQSKHTLVISAKRGAS